MDRPPDSLREQQPPGAVTIEHGDRRLFNLWPVTISELFLRDWCSEAERQSIYPVGSFICGDVVCWRNHKVSVWLHDDRKWFHSAVPWTEFIERMQVDPNLEDDTFARPLIAPSHALRQS